MKRLSAVAGILLLVAGLGVYWFFDLGAAIERQVRKNDALIAEGLAEHIGTLAYIYGYPLVDMHQQMHNETHRVSSEQQVHAPVNRFYRFPDLVTPQTSGNLRAPNADTLYFSGWYDISSEPLIIHTPNTDDRYFTIAVTNSYSEVVHIGRRTTGTAEGYFALVERGWDGELPSGVMPIECETPTGWLLGRMLVDGPEDFVEAKALVDEIWLASSSEFSLGRRPPMPAEKSADPMDVHGSVAFFEVMNRVMRTLPPRTRETALLAQFDAIGIGPAHVFALDALDDATLAGLEKAVVAGRAIVDASARRTVPDSNGWIALEHAGRYGDRYFERASVVRGGYANLPEESIYPARMTDSAGDLLSGANRYRLRFPAGRMPPADAFWSISAYNLNADATLEPNEIERYSLGDRTAGLRIDSDGSLTLEFQHKRPRDIANWLPVPEGYFILVMRLYEPSQEILQGTWELPDLERLDGD